MQQIKQLGIALTLLATLASPAKAQAYVSQGEFCREYTSHVNVGGRIQQGYGTACLQPDGTWQIVTASGVPFDAPPPEQIVIREYYDNYTPQPVTVFNLGFGSYGQRHARFGHGLHWDDHHWRRSHHPYARLSHDWHRGGDWHRGRGRGHDDWGHGGHGRKWHHGDDRHGGKGRH